jgi:hypothetical protein
VFFDNLRFRSGGSLESRSGAGVHPVVTADGIAAYLKIAPRHLAAPEVDFYRFVEVPVSTPSLIDFKEVDGTIALLLADAGSTVPVTRWTASMWGAVGRDLAALHAMPFVHGDFHTENVVWDGETPTYCDWQAAGSGRPSYDLALLVVRATAGGTTPPSAFFDAYGPTPGLREEIRAMVTDVWPRYERYNTPAANARVHALIEVDL